MENKSTPSQKQSASEFWRAYFAKFRRRVGDHEPSETGAAELSGVANLPFPDRRRPRNQRHSLLR